MIDTIQDSLVNCQLVNLFESTSKSCNDKVMTTHERIKQAREAAGYNSQKQLADKLDVSQQAVQQWESPNGTQPKTIIMNKLAAVLGVSVEWLLNGGEDIEDLPYALAPRCALINWEDIKAWPTNKAQLTNPKNINKITYPGSKILMSGKHYMLKLEDNSMVSRMEGQGFYKGGCIIVDPSREAKNKDFVVARFEDDRSPLFRQYISDGKNKHLYPLDIYKSEKIELTKDIIICGVVVAYLDILL